jgi:pimeloyl-ACP methyl ester carboxylesterase
MEASAWLLPFLLLPSLLSAAQRVQIAEGASSFRYVDVDGANRPMTIWTYRPPRLLASAKVVFVMHGVDRDGERYRDQWQPYAERHQFLLVAPEFDAAGFSEYAYHQGNLVDGRGNSIEKRLWTFSAIERLFDVVTEAARLRTRRYSLYGHSAGAQFVHRFVLFMPDARYERAVAANAGWYTLPTFETPFPYGLKGSPATEAGLKQSLGRDLVILLGENDTSESDPNLRSTERARAQGRTRRERGETFHRTAVSSSGTLGASLRWRRIVVPGAAHSNRQMAAAAASILAQ